jgi:hypothetical protein
MTRGALILVLLAAAIAMADDTLSIVPPVQPRCFVSRPCTLRLDTRGGRGPFLWRVVEGTLPRGMSLNRDTGVISGTPDIAGEYNPNIEVTDNFNPPQRARRVVTIVVQSVLSVEWVTLPGLHDNNTLSGALRVTNQVVAVNQIGKAFTLGYQHFSLPTGQTSPSIPFGMSMPSGTYRVRADAVGEVYPKNRIYRTSGESGTFVVP